MLVSATKGVKINIKFFVREFLFVIKYKKEMAGLSIEVMMCTDDIYPYEMSD